MIFIYFVNFIVKSRKNRNIDISSTVVAYLKPKATTRPITARYGLEQVTKAMQIRAAIGTKRPFEIEHIQIGINKSHVMCALNTFFSIFKCIFYRLLCKLGSH